MFIYLVFMSRIVLYSLHNTLVLPIYIDIVSPLPMGYICHSFKHCFLEYSISVPSIRNMICIPTDFLEIPIAHFTGFSMKNKQEKKIPWQPALISCRMYELRRVVTWDIWENNNTQPSHEPSTWIESTFLSFPPPTMATSGWRFSSARAVVNSYISVIYRAVPWKLYICNIGLTVP